MEIVPNAELTSKIIVQNRSTVLIVVTVRNSKMKCDWFPKEDKQCDQPVIIKMELFDDQAKIRIHFLCQQHLFEFSHALVVDYLNHVAENLHEDLKLIMARNKARA